MPGLLLAHPVLSIILLTVISLAGLVLLGLFGCALSLGLYECQFGENREKRVRQRWGMKKEPILIRPPDLNSVDHSVYEDIMLVDQLQQASGE